MTHSNNHPTYEPTPDEIRQRSEAIQRTWTSTQRSSRAGGEGPAVMPAVVCTRALKPANRAASACEMREVGT